MIRLKKVGKVFTLSDGVSNYLLKRVTGILSKKKVFSQVVALHDVSLEVKPGEFVSIIGANGSGKTTLLKIIGRVLQPSQGEVVVNGMLVPLLELGVGFQSELSAKENIVLYGTLLGIAQKDIVKKTEEILSFADLQEFGDAQLRTFSSGMQARLAFATAVITKPDILLVDEALAVGDIGFQEKCFRIFEEWKRQGKTIILVSHDMNMVNRFSDRVLLLHKGKVRHIGKPYQTIKAYYKLMQKHYDNVLTDDAHLDALEKAQLEIRKRDVEIQRQDVEIQRRDDYIKWMKGFSVLPKKRWGSKEIEITKVLLLDKAGKSRDTFKTGEVMTVRIFYKVNSPVENPIFGVVISSRVSHYFGTNTKIAKRPIMKLKKEGFVDCTIKRIPFLEGDFALSVNVHDVNDHHFDWHENFYRFEVMRTAQSAGLIDMDCAWDVKNAVEN